MLCIKLTNFQVSSDLGTTADPVPLPAVDPVESIPSCDLVINTSPCDPWMPSLDALVPTDPSLDELVPTDPSLDVLVPTDPSLDAVVATDPSLDAVVATNPSVDALVPTDPSQDELVATESKATSASSGIIAVRYSSYVDPVCIQVI